MTYVLIRESSIELLNAGGASAVWTAVIVVDVRMILMVVGIFRIVGVLLAVRLCRAAAVP